MASKGLSLFNTRKRKPRLNVSREPGAFFIVVHLAGVHFTSGVAYQHKRNQLQYYKERLRAFKHWAKYEAPVYSWAHDKLGVRFITAYELTLCEGGPEEGGWWYTDYAPLKTRVAHAWNENEVRCQLEAEFEHLKLPEGKTYTHTDGGHDMRVLSEEYPMESTTWVRPHYE